MEPPGASFRPRSQPPTLSAEAAHDLTATAVHEDRVNVGKAADFEDACLADSRLLLGLRLPYLIADLVANTLLREGRERRPAVKIP
jgi:hypothetical protein